MAKKNRIYDFDEDDDLVLDKKTKRRMERAKVRESQQQRRQEEQQEEEEVGNDTMSQIALMCQENRWREAVLTGRKALQEAQVEGKEDMIVPLTMALGKLEMSLRRQMAAVFIRKAEEMLKKEYRLDVGK